MIAAPLSCCRINHLNVQGIVNLIHHLPEHIAFFSNDVRLNLPHLLFERFSLFISFCGTTFKVARLNHNTFIAAGHFQRIIFHIFTRTTKDCVQEFFFRGRRCSPWLCGSTCFFLPGSIRSCS